MTKHKPALMTLNNKIKVIGFVKPRKKNQLTNGIEIGDVICMQLPIINLRTGPSGRSYAPEVDLYRNDGAEPYVRLSMSILANLLESSLIFEQIV